MRGRFLEQFNEGREERDRVTIIGDLCPSCRYNYRELMLRYDGDWGKTIQHVRVRRLIFSEQDRIGIGTFQPKDEKNQDSTELTGDINYRKIAIYGSDSDPRAFNFDGEFNIANRGIIEFIEMLKLDVAFLYDLLGASQEHKIKSKKFAQTDIDEVIIGYQRAGVSPPREQQFMERAQGTFASTSPTSRGCATRSDLRARLQPPQGARPYRPAHARGRRDVGRADSASRSPRRPA